MSRKCTIEKVYGFLISLALSACLLGACTVKPEKLLDSNAKLTVYREFLPQRADKSKLVEVFWIKPNGEGPWPGIVFVHGGQPDDRTVGGSWFVTDGRLEYSAKLGYVVAAVSQPGFGRSAGPADFCGPSSQEAALTVIDFLRRKSFVRRDKVAVYGVSRGAIVASMVATKDSHLAAVILVAGAYDLRKVYPTGIEGLDRSILREGGISDEAFRARSALYDVDKINAPVLLLHGALDDRFPPQQARFLAQKLLANNVPVRLKIFPYEEHVIPNEERYEEIYTFLRKYLQ